MKIESAIAKTAESLALDMLVAVGDLTKNRVNESIRLANAALSCVSPPGTNTERYEVIGGALVVDHQLQLMWPVDESEKEMDHDAREKYAADFRLGGFNTWRQPDPWELVASVWDLSRHNPCVNTEIFKSHGGWVGTRQPCAWSPGRVFVVRFGSGSVSNFDRGDEAFCRPVRSLVSGQ